MGKRFVIAIDGPAGSGKSTVAKLLARRLKVLYLDSGAIYRAVALAGMRRDINFRSQKEIVQLISQCVILVASGRIYLSGEDVSDQIRSEEVTRKTSYVAHSPLAREKIVQLERKIVGNRSAVVEGRDTATVVFPDAAVKIYLDASSSERAKRRHKELCAKGESASVKQVKAQIEKRDNSDRRRDVGPLIVAPRAVVVDTTALSIEQVVDKLEKIVKERKQRSGTRGRNSKAAGFTPAVDKPHPSARG